MAGWPRSRSGTSRRPENGPVLCYDPDRLAGGRKGTSFAVLDQSNNPQELQRLLMEYNEHPERRSDIVAEIDRRFRKPLGILVMDSCGFTRTVHTLGIVHFLALLERLARLVTPIINRHGGQVL